MNNISKHVYYIRQMQKRALLIMLFSYVKFSRISRVG